MLLPSLAGAAPVIAGTGDPVLINEVLASHTGTDDTEYIEFFGTPGASLDGQSLIVVESDSESSPGTIDRRLDFGPADILGSNGFFLVGNPVGLGTNYSTVPNIEVGANYLENSSLTVALVETSSIVGGSVTGAEVVLDSVALTDGGAGDTFFFGAPVIGPDGSFFPAGARRVTDGVDTDVAADWVISDFDLGSDNTPVSGDVAPPPPVVFVNEIQVSTTSDDWEFFELQGEPAADLSDLTLVGIESDAGTSAGTIDVVITLSGQSIPSDGFWLGISPAGEAAYGVTGEMSIGNNSFENGTATYFLVSGFIGGQGDDLDTNDDGSLDSEPWGTVLDAINIRDPGAGDYDYGAPSVGPDGSYLPSGTFRCPDAPAGTFGNLLNFSSPDGTPGTANECAPPPPPAVFVNEIQVSTSSTDWEFFELQGEPAADLSDLTLVGIESDAGSSAGTIDLVVSLAGQSIPSDGFWLGISPAGQTAYSVTGEMSIGDNSFENSTATYFLVTGFIGSKGDDLDTNDDGVLENQPWATVLDAINIRDSGTGDYDYGAPSVGPDGSNLPSGTFRCPDAPFGTFDSNMLNFSSPDGTPGTANECAPPPPPAVFMNEIQVSTSSTDWEFFELQGEPAADSV